MSKVISLSKQPTLLVPTDYMTLLLFGDTRSGKTRWAGTMPRPLFFSEHSEGGWKTLESMDRSLWYEPDVEPLVWTIEHVGDLPQLITNAKALITSGRVKTIVFDSITFYADLYLAFLTQGIPVEKQDPRQIYGKLGTHLRERRVEVHRLGVNVAWLALAAEPDDDHPNIRPMIPGKEGAKFGAGCSFIMYFRKQIAARGGAPPREHFDIFTRNEGKALAGCRDGGILPSPLPTNTYRGFIECFNNTRREAGIQTASNTSVVTAPSGMVSSSPARPQGAAPRVFKART